MNHGKQKVYGITACIFSLDYLNYKGHSREYVTDCGYSSLDLLLNSLPFLFIGQVEAL